MTHGSASPAGAERLRAAVVAGETSVERVVEETLATIARLDERVGAFRSVLADKARERAGELDSALSRGEEPGPLFGIPLALKSNMCLEGAAVDCGSRVLQDWRAPYTATFVERALEAGAVPIGMTHMDEFAMGSSGENSAFGVPRNPWDLARTSGGSSSGSAAAVASRMVPLALGSDTGGSVRQPAALCGICGLKPTYGRVSRYGLVAFASSLDQVSPLATNVRDIELLFGALAGRDPRDATSLAAPAPRSEEGADLAGLSIGLPHEFFPDGRDGLDPDVRTRVEEALGVLERLGARLSEVSLSALPLSLATYYVIATAEASSNLARYDGVRYGSRAGGERSLEEMFARTRETGFGDEVKRRILLGTYVLSSGYYDAWYRSALRSRGFLAREFDQAFERFDLLVGPTSPTIAFRLGERSQDPLAMYQSDVLTVPASLAGLPALSVPCGFARPNGSQPQDGPELPVGLQIVGPRGDDARVLRVGRIFQEHTAHHRALPPLLRGGEA